MYMKLRVCSPSPQTSISLSAPSCAAITLRHIAAGAFVSPVRAVHVVIARNARLESKVLSEVAAHPLAEEFFPAVSVLGHRRVRILFLQWSDVGSGLLPGRIDT